MMFDRKAYNKWDSWGKDIIIEWLSSKGHTLVHNPNRYGIDLYSDLNGKLYLWEVEVSTVRTWNNEEDYPNETVSFLGRKSKWSGLPFFYCIICSKTKAILCCRSQDIFKEAYKVEKYVANKDRVEVFYHVPKELCIFVKNTHRGGGH